MHPTLIQINCRLLLKKIPAFTDSLLQIPDQYWLTWKKKGFDWIWLMGMWNNSNSSVSEYAFDQGLKKDYSAANASWTEQDVTGSPYAIDRYEIWPPLGTMEDLRLLRQKLNGFGLKLMLDFVPNHYNAHSTLIDEKPELFLTGFRAQLQTDPLTYYERNHRVFAHGKDPYFDAWQDTIQLDYSNPLTQVHMTEVLQELTDYCDGVRCDMAMLLLNEIFSNTWNRSMPKKEFWKKAIGKTKEIAPDFTFMAEAYWDLEWQLQQLGFDYTYDKRLLDRMINGDVAMIHGHMSADVPYQKQLVRFLENHDEKRIISVFGPVRARAMAVIAYLLPGMRFFFDGQREGVQRKLPVQLNAIVDRWADFDGMPNTEPTVESASSAIFYDRLCALLQKPVVREGKYKLLPYGQDGVLQWQWIFGAHIWHIVVNIGHQRFTGSLDFDAKELFTGHSVEAGASFQLFENQFAVFDKRKA